MSSPGQDRLMVHSSPWGAQVLFAPTSQSPRELEGVRSASLFPSLALCSSTPLFPVGYEPQRAGACLGTHGQLRDGRGEAGMLIKPNPSIRGHARSSLPGLHETVGCGDVMFDPTCPSRLSNPSPLLWIQQLP